MNQEQQTRTFSRIQTAYGKKIAEALERNGFKKSIAGDDFAKCVEAYCIAKETKRGLLVTGPVGCGKTQLLRAIHSMQNAPISTFVYCKDNQKMNTVKNCPEYYLQWPAFLDDIGCEEVRMEYGNTIDIIGDFIQLYHFKGNGKLYCTTNLTPKEINKKYGGRVLDRLLYLCVFLGMSGESHREKIIIR